MLNIDGDKLLEAITKGVSIALRNLGRRWDDEYLSDATLHAMYSLKMFKQYRTKRDVYEFVTFCTIRHVKKAVLRDHTRRSRYTTPDALDSVADCNKPMPDAEPGDERLVKSLASGNRVTGPSNKSRKVWEIRKLRLKRLKKTYGRNEPNGTETT